MNLLLPGANSRGLFASQGAQINLLGASVLDTASIGDVVGALSVSRGSGSYTYSFTNNPGSLFSITGASLKVAALLTAGAYPITIKADNGAGFITRAFLILVTHVGSTNFTATFISQGQF